MTTKVCNCATLKCPFGAAPSTLVVLPENRVLTSNQPAANIMDNKPMVNIMPFGMCNSMANPAVASATAAASGVLTPMPCTPMTTAPWAPGAPQTLIANMPALTQDSKLMCAFGGVIEVVSPGQETVAAE